MLGYFLRGPRALSVKIGLMHSREPLTPNCQINVTKCKAIQAEQPNLKKYG